MKKMIFSILAIGLVSANLSAAWLTGTISNVGVYGDTVYIMVGSSNKRVDPALSIEAKKVMNATALTAFASGTTVKLRYSETTSGTWDAIQLIK